MSDVGEIVGRLRIDEGNWYRELDRAQAKAEELGSSNPRVTVTASTREAVRELDATAQVADRVARDRKLTVRADTAGARTQLDATARSAEKVAVAEFRMKAAVQASDRATAVALLAQMRLEEVQNKRGRTALQVATAEETLRYATEKADSAAVKATLAEDRLAAANREAASAALLHAGAEETLEGAIDRVSRRADSGAGRVALWTSAIIAAVPLLEPIAGLAVAGTVALGGLGAAGILAGTGIARGMKTGEGATSQYRPLVQQVLNDIHDLQDTAAVGLLPGADETLDRLQARMPLINRGVAEFSTRLGSLAPTALDAVVGLVEEGIPLWRSGADWIGRMVQGLADFSRSDAYKSFIDYSVRNGPQVERFLSHVVQLAGDILAAWAPYGETVLPVLDDTVVTVGHIVTALGPVLPAAASVYLAFRAWTGITAIVDGITTSVALLGTTSTATGGKVAAAGTAARGAGLLAAAGWAAAGLALTQYAAQQAAQWNYNQTRDMTPGSPEQKHAAAAMAAAASMKAPQSTGGGGMDLGLGAAFDKAYGKQREVAAATDTSTAAQLRQAAAARVMAAAIRDAAVSANNLAAAEIKASGQAQALEGSSLGAKDAIAQAGKAIKDNGTSLSENTDKGRANRGMILAAVSSISAYGAALIKGGASAETAQIAQDRMGVSLENTLVKMGMSRKAAGEYIAKLLGIPKNVSTKADLDAKLAQQKARSAKQAALDFARGDYTAALKADPSNMKSKVADAQKRAVAMAQANYTAFLKANPQNAKANVADAARQARAFAGGAYTAAIRANASQAIGAARSAQEAILAVKSRQVTITAVYRATGSAQIAKNYAQLGGATGGTAGAASFGTMRSIRGLAGGGTIFGAGSAATDTAGLYRLARGEEVTSNVFGQAERNRPMLKAINTGDQARIRRTAQEQYGADRSPQVVRTQTIAPQIHIHNPVARDPEEQTAEAAQLALAAVGLG